MSSLHCDQYASIKRQSIPKLIDGSCLSRRPAVCTASTPPRQCRLVRIYRKMYYTHNNNRALGNDSSYGVVKSYYVKIRVHTLTSNYSGNTVRLVRSWFPCRIGYSRAGRLGRGGILALPIARALPQLAGLLKFMWSLCANFSGHMEVREALP
jgi:hypothetical protein